MKRQDLETFYISYRIPKSKAIKLQYEQINAFLKKM